MSLNAFTIARRHSIRNEHDLVQEDFVDVSDDLSSLMTPPGSPFSKKDCLLLMGKKGAGFDVGCSNALLPPTCEQFDEIRVELQRRLSNQANHAVTFQGMPAGEAAAAMASRDKGHLSHAQIQRRMTNTRQPRLW